MLARSENRWLAGFGTPERGGRPASRSRLAEYGALYDFRAGRIRRVRQFATYAEALEAAGLRE